MSKQEIDLYLQDAEFIALCDVLKLAGLAESGGRAKAVIAAGEVRRNGETETRKTAKIRAGETVEYAGAAVRLRAGFQAA